jgi:cysteinyl-tRNA synthetase
VLHLYDPRTQRPEPVTPARRGELRVYSCGPVTMGPPGLDDLRSLLLPDLIRRTAERQRLRVVTCQPSSEGAAEPGGAVVADASLADGAVAGGAVADGAVADGAVAALRADGSALNLRPPDIAPDPAGTAAEITRLTALLAGAGPGALSGTDVACAAMVLQHLGGTVDIHTGSRALASPHHEHVRAVTSLATGHEVTRHWAHSAPVTVPPDADALDRLAGRGLDPLALRLALLEHRYRDELKLTWDDLTSAHGELARWRGQVADWARSPSRPISTAHNHRLTAAFDDDLDTPAALLVLRALAEDPAVPAGSKFETFADADRLLGLDLAQDVGRASADTQRIVG